MDRSRHRLVPGVVLDARRAVWLEAEGVLAVADLHLGYAWAHRAAGQMLPVAAEEDTLRRLAALGEEYAPRELVVLGDVVHRAVPVPALREALGRLAGELGAGTSLRLVVGNHDRRLAALLAECGLDLPLERERRAGPHLLVHGDADAATAARQLADAVAQGGRVLCGHEHPAITLGDGVASVVKCPCFLLAGVAVVLPAFSPWAAGSDVRAGRAPLSSLLALARAERAVAILAGKLLPVPLGRSV